MYSSVQTAHFVHAPEAALSELLEHLELVPEARAHRSGSCSLCPTVWNKKGIYACEIKQVNCIQLIVYINWINCIQQKVTNRLTQKIRKLRGEFSNQTGLCAARLRFVRCRLIEMRIFYRWNVYNTMLIVWS